MPVQLKYKTEKELLPMDQMRDGQLAIVVSNNSYNGQVVQMLKGNSRHTIKNDVVISVGSPNGQTWSAPVPSSVRVRPLRSGECIQVTVN